MKKLFLIVILLSISASIYPQNIKSSDSKDFTEVQEENYYLKNQIEEMKRTDDRLINIIIWTLGTSLAIVLIVVGLQSYVNIKAIEKEKNLIKESLVTLIMDELNSQKISILKEINKNVEEIFQNLQEKNKSQYDYLRKGIMLTMVGILTTNFFKSMKSKSYSAAIKHCDVILDFSMELKDDERIGKTLDLLNIVLSQDFKPDVDVVAKLLEKLEDLPKKYKIEKDSIVDKLKKRRK